MKLNQIFMVPIILSKAFTYGQPDNYYSEKLVDI
jgi:hypothetical protein